MNTQDAMRKVTSGELCEFALRDGSVVKVLDRPTSGRVKVQIDSAAQELLLRDLRNLFDTVGFAESLPAYRPHDHTSNEDAYGALQPGKVCFSVVEDMICAPTVRAVDKALRSMDIDTSALCWRLQSPDGTLLQKIVRLAAQQGKSFGCYDNEQIGNIIARGTLRKGDYWLDVTDRFNWHSGDFGDAGSCYWGGRAAARDALQDYGAYAIRFFTPSWDDGIGRAWIAPTGDDGIVVFNAYGSIAREDLPDWNVRRETATLDNVGAIVSLLTSATGKRVQLTNNCTDCGTVWINNGSGYKLGGSLHSSSVDLEVDDNEGYECCNCGDRLHEDDTCYTEGGDGPYCQYCYSELFAHCELCDCDFDRDEANELTCRTRWESYATNHTVCPHCFERHGGERCYECGDVISTEVDNYQHDDDGEIYCESCASIHLRICAGCDEYKRHDDMDVQHGEYVCSSCVRAGAVVCGECGTVNHDCDCLCQVAEPDQLAFSYSIAAPCYVMR